MSLKFPQGAFLWLVFKASGDRGEEFAPPRAVLRKPSVPQGHLRGPQLFLIKFPAAHEQQRKLTRG